MNSYCDYKDSGAPWLGEVPAHWRLERAKWHFSVRNERGNTEPVLLAATQKNGMYPQEKVEGVVKVADGTDIQQFKTVHKGDFVISLRSFQGGFERSDYEGVCSPAYQVFFADQTVWNNDYLKFLFKDVHFIDAMNALTVGIREGRNIKYEDFANSLIAIPPRAEQTAIAEYLLSRAQEIDNIISEAKASIEEYKTWKATIIYEAVTKGLDPNAETKDSGVFWIGNIPANWTVCKTLFALSMPITDGPHTTPELYDEGVPFVSAEAVSCGNGRIDFDHIRGYISEEFYQECCLKYIPQRNDIYMIKSGATTGRVSYVDTDIKFTIWSPLAVFRASEKRMYYKYLFYFLQSDAYQKQVALGWTYGTQQNIGMRTLETLKLCMPPLAEQHRIADFLDKKCNTIDSLIEEKTALVKDLESYKKALIFEVVTGKRRVC